MASKRDLLKNKIKRHAEIGAKNNVDKSKEYIERIISNGELIEVDPSKVGIWEYANRSANEMGDMTELAESIKEFGQIQPAVIVPKSSSFMPKDDANNVEYVVIAGRRRREACLAYNIKYLACLHTNLDVETALEIQRVENSEREDISDFSEGMSYYQAIKDGKASHKKLFEKSNTSKAKVTMLLSFGNIKDSYPELFNEISDFSKVSSRVAYDILSHAKKGKEDVLKANAKAIRQGNVGSRKLEALINSTPKEKSIYEFKGKKYMTYDNNRLMINLINIKNKDEVVSSIQELLESYLGKEALDE